MASDPYERLGETLENIRAMHNGLLEFPTVFTDADRTEFEDPSRLAEIAQETASMRERSAFQVSAARRLGALAEAMFSALEGDVTVAFEQRLADQSQRMIAGGTAWQERAAAANLSVLDRRVQLRGVELRVKNARAQVREMEDCYEAWRQTEWALDRQARLLQLRTALGEV